MECTFYANGAPYGGALAYCGVWSSAVTNCILSFSIEGTAVWNAYDDIPFTCCDIYGNAGGDWVAGIEGQYGINGNICEDPLFCDPEDGNFTLECISPCAPVSPPTPECDLIGAWPAGCGGTPTTRSTWGGVKALFRR